MLKKAKIELFWFLKKDAVFDLDDPKARQIYVQQVLSKGREDDIRELFRDIGREEVRIQFEQAKHFLPVEVRLFWENFFADHHTVSKHTS
jgi:hypothetical protein